MRKMQEKLLAILLVIVLAVTLYDSTGRVQAAVEGRQNAEADSPVSAAETDFEDENVDSTVYMTTDISPAGLMKVYQGLSWTPSGKVAVKLSTGEPPASNYLSPDLIKELVQYVDGTIVECNTAYGGSRSSNAMHYQVAKDHGFTEIADFQILDEEGSMTLPVRGGSRLTENYVGAHFSDYDSYLVLSHFKGHAMAGFGGAIKNISIGLGSSEGKCWIHTAGTSKTNPWGGNQDAFLEAMGEAGKSVSDYLGNGKNIVYVNVMNRLSVDCDCDGNPAEPKMRDIGILASTDPVALDQACIDLVYDQKDGEGSSLVSRIESRNGLHTLEHAQSIGLGNRAYRLVDMDNQAEVGPCSHDYTDRVTVQPACVTAGERTYTCTKCGDLYTEEIPADGHDIVIDQPTEASCTKTGRTEGSHCRKCETILTIQKEIPAKGHSYKTNTIPATTKKDGSMVTQCSVCQDIESESVIRAVKSINLSSISYVYNGKTRKPSVSIKDREGGDLKEGTDYKVVYPKGMKNVGKYVVTVSFMGRYAGSGQKAFAIVPKSTSITKVTPKEKGFQIRWKKRKGQISGYEVSYSADSKFAKSQTKSKSVKGYGKTSLNVTGLKAGRTYYVRVRTYKKTGNVKLYSKWSGKKTVKIKKS